MSRRNPREWTVPSKIWDHETQMFVELEFGEMTIGQLRAVVEKTLGVKPHHRTGRKRLIGMLHGLENEHTNTPQG
jgi:hypothetical protein